MVRIGGNVFGNEIYPNNERIFKKLNLSNIGSHVIEFTFETDMDIFNLIIAKKWLDDAHPNQEVFLVMSYVPYSRMDRETKDYIPSIKYVCQLINDLNFKNVYILDAHSNVTELLLNKCVTLDLRCFINGVFNKDLPDFVFYPDSGAQKRYNEILKFPTSITTFYGNKKRDLTNGKIVDFELVNPPDLKDKTVLIIDDLCSFGNTFIKSAEKLKQAGAKRVILYVSHCEYNITKGEILRTDLIDAVYTTDSIFKETCYPKITVLKIKDLIGE